MMWAHLSGTWCSLEMCTPTEERQKKSLASLYQSASNQKTHLNSWPQSEIMLQWSGSVHWSLSAIAKYDVGSSFRNQGTYIQIHGIELNACKKCVGILILWRRTIWILGRHKPSAIRNRTLHRVVRENASCFQCSQGLVVSCMMSCSLGCENEPTWILVLTLRVDCWGCIWTLQESVRLLIRRALGIIDRVHSRRGCWR